MVHVSIETQRLMCHLRAPRDRWLGELKDAANTEDELDIVVDFSAVQRLSSLELNELVRLHLRLRQRGQRLVFEGPQATVRDVFSLTRLDRLIEVREFFGSAPT